MRKLGYFSTLVLLSIVLVSCKGGSSGQLKDLAGGDISEVDRVTITQVLPDGTTATIEQAQTQTFFVTAAAPLGRAVTFTWEVNGVEVQKGPGASYSISGGATNIGQSTLKLTATDGQTEDTHEWTVKVNGPPVITAVTTGTPKVSVGSTINIVATATDPNAGDTLTYTWTLNGLPSTYLTNVDGTATLTGNAAIVGSLNIALTVSDGTASATQSWTAEVNYFPTACNSLTNGQICTIAGSPSIGDGATPGPSQVGIRIRPIDVVMDNLNNYIFADYVSHVLFYWNRTGADVTKYNVTIPAGQLKVIAGTGEAATGSDGFALQSSLNFPRALAYDTVNDELYVGTWNGHRVKRINQTGIVSTVMGISTSQVDGAASSTHRCRNVRGLHYYNNAIYASCHSEHRVKRIDLATSTATTVMGNGTTGLSANGTAMPGQLRNPAGLFVDADGIYVAAGSDSRIIFANHSGADKNMFGSTVSNGDIWRIIGDGGAGQNNDVAPASINANDPQDIVVVNNSIYWGSLNSNRDSIYVANNTGGNLNYGNVSVNANIAKRLTFVSTGNNMAGYNGSGVDHQSARVRDVYGMIYDTGRNDLVFADYGNNRVRTIDFTDNELKDLVGSGQIRQGYVGDIALPSTEHLFVNPSGIAFENSSRTLFFTDANNYRVRQVDAFGRVSTAMGRGAGDPITDNDIPSNVLLRTNVDNDVILTGLDVGSDGLIVQANSNGHNIRAWNRTGASGTFFGQFIVSDAVSTIAGDYLAGAGDGPVGPATSALLAHPNDVAVYGTGASRLVYIVDRDNHCIRRIDNTGALTTVVGLCGNNAAGTNNIGAITTGMLNEPSGITVDTNGNLIIADRNNHKVRYANLNTAPSISIANVTIPVGQVATIACNSGTVGDANENVLSIGSRCNNPSDVAVHDDDICFSNTSRHNVRCISIVNGLIRTVAGANEATPRAGSPSGFEMEGISATSARLYNPRALTFDNLGDLYISDLSNHIIRKVKLSP